MKSFLEHKEN